MNPASRTLSEHASKQLLADYGVPIARERLVASADAAVAAAEEVGFTVALKLCGAGIAHKTERDLVRLNVVDVTGVRAAADDLLARRRPEDGEVGLLVAEMVRGHRELIAGLVRDPQLGTCVMLGLGGILTEVLGDAVFASVPLRESEARRMPAGLRARDLLTRPLRGEPALVDDALVPVLLGLSRLASERPEVASVDVNRGARAK